MDYASKLERLEHLRALVDQFTPIMYGSSDEGKRLLQEICEVYGQVADVFEEVLGKQRIEVPHAGCIGTASEYPNLFEAGFLSGRTIHTHQGKTELLKVIGKVKALVGQDTKTANLNRGWGIGSSLSTVTTRPSCNRARGSSRSLGFH